MSSELVFSAMAMVVSMVALGSSTLLSAVQAKSMRKANDLPVMIELLIKEYVNDDFQGRERLVIETLADTSADLGFDGCRSRCDRLRTTLPGTTTLLVSS